MGIENCSNLRFYGIKVTAVFNSHSVIINVRRKGKILGQFIDDLKSGKLHREFHFGPDEEEDKVRRR